MRFPANASDQLRTVLQQLKRQALHACSIVFSHPETDEELKFEAPLPDDFKLLLNTLDQHYED
jgi:23S rRNA pseudouridine1911/1915/1917 synthase